MALGAICKVGRLAPFVVLALSCCIRPALANVESFDQWLAEVRKEALSEGISQATLDMAFDGVEPIARVVEIDRSQVETRISFDTYKARVLSESRVERGRELYRAHKPLLERIAADYGVPPRFIVALWGIESTYGSHRGDYPVFGALATLAYDGRRAAFFRRELLNALRIVQQGDAKAEEMLGSWAGAMGQNQFMPSSYLAYAVDYDQDGRRDIWSSLPDVLASIANFLARAGWHAGYTWGREVSLPGSIDGVGRGLETRRTLAEWQALGVRRSNGRDLPEVRLEASLLQMDEGAGPAYLVYHNFRVLMNWNRSTYFGLAVGELADLLERG
ncbi:MAG: lytic murein transglycosylase [Geminicoccaceae bacterium]